MNDFFNFRMMVSSKLIQIVYILGMIVILLAGIETMSQGGGIMILGWIAIIVFGNLAWRIVCEIWILVFSIHDILAAINRNLSDMKQLAPSPERTVH